MQDFEQRVVTELSELQEKINKLDVFVRQRPVQMLESEWGVLKSQLAVMQAYAAILVHRVAQFNP